MDVSQDHLNNENGDTANTLTVQRHQPAVCLTDSTQDVVAEVRCDNNAVVTSDQSPGVFKRPSQLPLRMRRRSRSASAITSSAPAIAVSSCLGSRLSEGCLTPKPSTFFRIVSSKVLRVGSEPPLPPPCASANTVLPSSLTDLHRHYQQPALQRANPAYNCSSPRKDVSSLQQPVQPGKITLVSHGKTLQTPPGVRSVRDLSQGYVITVGGSGHSSSPDDEVDEASGDRNGEASLGTLPVSSTATLHSGPALSHSVVRSASPSSRLLQTDGDVSLPAQSPFKLPLLYNKAGNLQSRSAQSQPRKQALLTTAAARHRRILQRSFSASNVISPHTPADRRLSQFLQRSNTAAFSPLMPEKLWKDGMKRKAQSDLVDSLRNLPDRCFLSSCATRDARAESRRDSGIKRSAREAFSYSRHSPGAACT